MPFRKEKTAYIQREISESLSSEKVNDWERSFLQGMAKRFSQYSERTRLSVDGLVDAGRFLFRKTWPFHMFVAVQNAHRDRAIGWTEPVTLIFHCVSIRKKASR
ncbi:hypothetical protein [Tritonibacter mobilis]|uniref:hypothetical protein n=1 Tax=Tritonibacter mobilis TaxID=379347 RepID=UPI000806EBC3|nr:hypothetical protein [Tritonibacter mobilis]